MIHETSFVLVELAIERRPNQIDRFKKVKSIKLALPLSEETRDWLDVLKELYGFESIQAYATAHLKRHNYGRPLVFETYEILEIVAPAERNLSGLLRARFLFAEALDSDLSEDSDFWGDGWRLQDGDAAPEEEAWREEIDDWLKGIGETKYRTDWHQAMDHAIADRVRELGELVRRLILPWRTDKKTKGKRQ